MTPLLRWQRLCKASLLPSSHIARCLTTAARTRCGSRLAVHNAGLKLCLAQGLLNVDLCISGTERSVAYILTLGTDEAYRRRGLASTLLARTLSACQARGLCTPGSKPPNATPLGGPPLQPALPARDNVQRRGFGVLRTPRIPDVETRK